MKDSFANMSLTVQIHVPVHVLSETESNYDEMKLQQSKFVYGILIGNINRLPTV